MGAARKFVLVPTGSAGDIRPFLWLGQELRNRGHEVATIIHAPFGKEFAAAGLHARVYATTEDFEDLLRHPDLWHPRRGFSLIARAAERYYRFAVPLIQEEIIEGRTTLVASGLAFAARIVAEVTRAPLVTIQLQPAAFLSRLAPPVLRSGWEWFLKSPRWLRPCIYQFVWWHTDWLLAAGLNTYRAELGLTQPVRHIMQDYWMSPQRVVALFPDWFAARQADWPPQTVLTRFPPEPEPPSTVVDPEIDEFLREGDPPVVITPGTAHQQAGPFLRTALAVTQRLGWRALVLTRFAAQVPQPLPPGARLFPWARLSTLLPRCRALLHHGGIGTVAQAFAAGIPQCIVPFSHDQPDNAYRVRQLGVGDYLAPARFTPDVAADRLRSLLGSDAVARACREIRERARPPQSSDDVLRHLEDLA